MERFHLIKLLFVIPKNEEEKQEEETRDKGHQCQGWAVQDPVRVEIKVPECSGASHI